MSLSGRPVYDPNSLRPNPNPKKPVSGSYRVRRLGQTLTPLPIGTVTLPVVVGSYPQQIAKSVNFLVVDCSSSYNAIIGRPTLNSWKAVTSTYHLSVKFPTEYGIGQAQENQLAARKCYLAMMALDKQVQIMSIEERRFMAKPTEVLEDVPLEEGNPEKFTRIGTSMEEKTKQDLV